MKRTMLFKWLLLLSGLHICALVSADITRIRVLRFLKPLIRGKLISNQIIILLFLLFSLNDQIAAQNTNVAVETHHGLQEMKVYEETPKSLFFSEMTFNASQGSSGINDYNAENIRHPRMLEIMYNDSNSLNNYSIQIFESDEVSPIGSIDWELHDSNNRKKNDWAKGISSSVIASIPFSNLNCSFDSNCNTTYSTAIDNYDIMTFDLQEHIDELSNYNPCSNCDKIFGIGIYNDIEETLVDFVSYGYGLFVDDNNQYFRSSVIQSDKRSYYVFDPTNCTTNELCFDDDVSNDDCEECDYIMAVTDNGPIESIKLTDEGWEKYPSPESISVFNSNLTNLSTSNFLLKYQHPAVGLVQTLPFTYTFFDVDFNLQPLKVTANTGGAWADNYPFWNFYNGAEPYIEYSFLYYPYSSDELTRYNTDALTTHFGLHNVIDYYWETFAYSDWREKPILLHYSPEWHYIESLLTTNPTTAKLLEEGEEWKRDGDWRKSNPYSIATAGATLDIVAHEMGHRFNSDHMMLPQSWINEGLADVWSNLIEARTMDPNEDNPDYPDYDLRNRNNPDINLVRSFSYKAYNTTSFTNCGTFPNHCRGRVISHWYRLLTEGGSGTKNFTSACNGEALSYSYDIEPISLNDFEQLFYKANEIARDNPDFNRVGSGDSDWADIFEIRDATIKAAEITFPNDLSIKRKVIDAWKAVNLLRQCDTEIYVSSNSSLVLLEDNDIDIDDVATMGENVHHTIYVIEGETLIIEDGVNLNFVDGHDISVEPGGTLIIKNADITLSDDSEISVYGELIIEEASFGEKTSITGGTVAVKEDGLMTIQSSSVIDFVDGHDISVELGGTLIINSTDLSLGEDSKINIYGDLLMDNSSCTFTDLSFYMGDLSVEGTGDMGDITVQAGGKMSIKNESNLSMSQEFDILVNKGGRLEIDNSTLDNITASPKWNGIVVLGAGENAIIPEGIDQIINGDYPLSEDNHGVVIVKGGSKIKNAKVAIQAPKSWAPFEDTQEYRGGIIISDNDNNLSFEQLTFEDIDNETFDNLDGSDFTFGHFNQFIENDIGILIDQQDPYGNGCNVMPTGSYIQNSLFIDNLIGVDLYGVQGMELNDDTEEFENRLEISGNIFIKKNIPTSLMSGVNIYKSSIIVGGNDNTDSDKGNYFGHLEKGVDCENEYYGDFGVNMTICDDGMGIYVNYNYLKNIKQGITDLGSSVSKYIGNDFKIPNEQITYEGMESNGGSGWQYNSAITDNAYGIYTHSVIIDAYIHDNDFKDDQTNTQNNEYITAIKSVNTNLSCNANRFDDLTKAVDLYNINAAFQATIEDNTIDNTLKGITANTTPFAIMKGNTITVPNSLSEAAYDAYGIWMQDCAGFSIEDNVINTNITAADYANGIIIDDSDMLGAGGSRIVNNLFEGAFSNASYIKGANNALQFDCNNYKGCQTDWYIAENALLGQQGTNVSDPNPILFRQSWHDVAIGGMHILNDSNTAVLLFASDESSEPNPLLIDGPVSVNDGAEVGEDDVECGENYDVMVDVTTIIGSNGNSIDCIAPSVDTYQATSHAVRENLGNDQMVCAEEVLEGQAENWSDWVLVATYISTRDYIRAEQKMTTINIISTEDQQLYDLYSTMISVAQNGDSAGKASIVETVITPKLEGKHSQTVKSLAEAAMAHLNNESRLRSVRQKSTIPPNASSLADMLLTAYPNPTNASLSVSWSKIENFNPSSLIITDLYGSVIDQYLIETNTYSQIVNFEDVVNGMYFCYLEDSNGQRSTITKVVVID